ncbi:MAG: HEAT repeat domain-containing protein [Planctomycetota bacterium]|nr:HEAT repeat domain-containing protein [Planctomycetota bacterium]
MTSYRLTLLISLISCAIICAGCADTGSSEKPETGGTTVTDIRDLARDVPQALMKFGSKNPAQWRTAYAELEALPPELVSRELVRVARVALDPDSAEGAEARRKLARQGQIEMQLAKINTSEYEKWDEAREALLAMGPDAAECLVIKLIKVFKRNTATQWDWAREQMVTIGGQSIPYLVAFIESQSAPQSLKDQCAETVVQMGKTGEGTVRSGIAAADPRVRMAYAAGLGARVSILSMELLKKVAADPDWQVRGVAMQSFGKLKLPESVPVLITALRDAEPVVCHEAAEALAAINDRRAIVPLIDLLRRTRPSQVTDLIRVDTAAVRALRSITGQKFGTNADEWARWFGQNK